MNNSRMLAGLAIACVAYLSACVNTGNLTNPGIVEVAPDQYLLTRLDVGGALGNAAALKAKMIEEANAFADSKGKRAVPVPFDELPGFPSCNPQVVEYNFRLVDPHQAAAPPAAKAQRVERLADGILRLQQLRQQGLLTENEFQVEKQRLLQTN
jgi:hypothetical protein